MSERKVVGIAKAFSTKNDWWAILLSTEEEGEIWIAPGIKTERPCPAQKGQLIEAVVQGRWNQVVNGQFTAKNRFVDEPAPVARPQKQDGYKPKVNIGQTVGHACNGAVNLVGYKTTLKKMIEAGEFIYDTTQEVKEIYQTQHPDLSDYEVGATVGQAIHVAANIVREKKKDHSELKQITLDILSSMHTALKEYIEASIEAKNAKITESVEAAPEKTQEEKVVESEVEAEEEAAPEVEEEVQTEAAAEAQAEDDLDDDLPW